MNSYLYLFFFVEKYIIASTLHHASGEMVRRRNGAARAAQVRRGGGQAPAALPAVRRPVPNDENAKSLAFPTEMAISGDGTTLYVAALGSSKVGVYSTAELETDTFTPSTANQVTLTGAEPGRDWGDKLYYFAIVDGHFGYLGNWVAAWH